MKKLQCRKQEAKEYLDSIGAAIPHMKNAPLAPEALIVNNKKLVEWMHSFVILFTEKVSENTENKSLAKEASKILSSKNKTKKMIAAFDSCMLDKYQTEIGDTVVQIFLDTLYVDDNHEFDEVWLDIGTPLMFACSKEINKEDVNTTTLDALENVAGDFLDFCTMYVSRFIFMFARELDEMSRDQILGNIGGFSDIRAACKMILLSKIADTDEFTKFLIKFINTNKK